MPGREVAQALLDEAATSSAQADQAFVDAIRAFGDVYGLADNTRRAP